MDVSGRGKKGIGPFLVYSLILKQHATWQTALGIVFWAGLAIFLLSLFKVRQKILIHLPPSIKAAAIGGIGLFLIAVGLKDLGIFQGSLFTLPNAIALFGLLLFFTLHHFKIASAFILSILASWLLAIPFHLTTWNGLAALPPSLIPTFLQLDLLTPLQPQWLSTILSVILIALFDTSASLTALAKMAHKLDSNNHIKNLNRIVIPDGLGSLLSALLGSGTLTFTLESSSGIKAGGRTGLTAITAALCCLIGLFFYPLISSIPLFATTPILIAIGLFMAQEIKAIHWKDLTESLPALITLLTIPLTFSIYLGFALGFVSYTLLKALQRKWKAIHPVCWALSLIFAAHLFWSLI